MKKGKGDKASKAINNNTKNGSKARDEFFLAVRSGNFQHFDALLTGNPALLTATDNDETALAIACESRYVDIVDKLLQQGAMPAANPKKPIIICMVSKNDYYLSRRLLECGADVNESAEDGRTALHWACDDIRTDCLRVLLNFGANPNVLDKKGMTPLHYCCRLPYFRLVTVDFVMEMLLLLLQHGADPNLGAETGLMFTCREGTAACVDALLSHGGDPNLAEKYGYSALYFPCMGRFRRQEDLVIVQRLLGAGADLHHKDKDGKSLLFHACAKGDIPVITCLLDHGANPNDQDKQQESVLLTCAGIPGGEEVIYLLVQRGALVNTRNKHNSTPLHVACRHEQLATATFLLTQGVDPNLQDKSGKTALHFLCLKNCKEGIELLLSHGADAYIEDNDGRTAVASIKDLILREKIESQILSGAVLK